MTISVPINVELSKEMQKHVTLTFLQKQLENSIRSDLEYFNVECDDFVINDKIRADKVTICDYHPHSGNYNYRETSQIRLKTKDLYHAIDRIKEV